uniref:PABS domain-containing protein n=1 Tax=Pyrodinium bahamense TaxID=73915 RepID=A0A7S0A0U7_9DINO
MAVLRVAPPPLGGARSRQRGHSRPSLLLCAAGLASRARAGSEALAVLRGSLAVAGTMVCAAPRAPRRPFGCSRAARRRHVAHFAGPQVHLTWDEVGRNPLAALLAVAVAVGALWAAGRTVGGDRSPAEETQNLDPGREELTNEWVTQLRVRMRSDCLPLTYTKTFVSVVLATLSLLGAPLFVAPAAGEPPLRILCIGLGGGSVPSFLAAALPRCMVDVVELEAPVLRAATEALGFYTRPNLRVVLEDGAAFAQREAERASSPVPGNSGYDAVLVDAYDAAGHVPSALWARGSVLAAALASGLLRKRGSLVATNLLPKADPTPALASYNDALALQGAGPGFTVQAPGTGNRIVVQTCPREGSPLVGMGSRQELQVQLTSAARGVREATGCPFEMEALAARNFQEWLGEQEPRP